MLLYHEHANSGRVSCEKVTQRCPVRGRGAALEEIHVPPGKRFRGGRGDEGL